MRYIWDQKKCMLNIQIRSLDFRRAVRLFNDPHRLVWEDLRQDYGELRINMLACMIGRVYAVTYTSREDTIRIISFRKANPREQKRYEQSRFH